MATRLCDLIKTSQVFLKFVVFRDDYMLEVLLVGNITCSPSLYIF